MDKINQEKLVNYSNSATKGAAIGGAAGAVFSSGLAIKNFLDDKKFSKMVMESPPDTFEKIAKMGIISFNQEAAEKNGELLKAGLKLDEVKKQLINLHKKLSKSENIKNMKEKNFAAWCSCYKAWYGKEPWPNNQVPTKN